MLQIRKMSGLLLYSPQTNTNQPVRLYVHNSRKTNTDETLPTCSIGPGAKSFKGDNYLCGMEGNLCGLTHSSSWRLFF